MNDIKADYEIGGGWGDRIFWCPSDQFDSWDGDENQRFKVAGFKKNMPRKGQTLLAEFEKSWIVFKFTKINRMHDPPDQFFAYVKPFKQITKEN